MARKAFTVAEAESLLPDLERALAGIQARHRALERAHERLQILDALWGPRVRDPANPDHGELLDLEDSVQGGIREIEEAVRREILARGVRFPTGGLEHGLLDFPTTLDGRWVYLCWRLGEPRLLAWHELRAGFAGRRPILPEEAARMGVGATAADSDGLEAES